MQFAYTPTHAHAALQSWILKWLGQDLASVKSLRPHTNWWRHQSTQKSANDPTELCELSEKAQSEDKNTRALAPTNQSQIFLWKVPCSHCSPRNVPSTIAFIAYARSRVILVVFAWNIWLNIQTDSAPLVSAQFACMNSVLLAWLCAVRQSWEE